jgi:hypothetical protein
VDLRPDRQGGAQHRKFYQELTDELCQLVRSAVLTPSFEPVPPWGREYLWHWFVDLVTARQEGQSGPQPLAWQDMAQWAFLTAAAPTMMEWRTLRAMDGAYIAACREYAERERNASKAGTIHSERQMTPDLFDAVFG